MRMIKIIGLIGGAYDYWTSNKTVGTTADHVRHELMLAGEHTEVGISIRSTGGDVKEALEIYELLAKHKGRKTVMVDKIAAGAASVIAMAGDKIRMTSTSMLMIGNPCFVTIPDPFFDPRSELLELRSKMIAAYRSNNPNMSEAECDAAMDVETWYSASAAQSAGFRVEIDDDIELEAA